MSSALFRKLGGTPSREHERPKDLQRDREFMPTKLETEELAVALDALARFRRILSLPEAALRIVQVSGRPDCAASDLAELFRRDPGLGATLMKVANSPFYGLRNQVTQIDHATMLLGVSALRGIAVAASVGQMLKRGSGIAGFSMRSLWRHHVRIGALARLAAEHFELGDPDEAFTAGLLHDLGLVVMQEIDQANFSALYSEPIASASEREQRECEAFGARHSDFGAAFALSLGLPEILVEAILTHHRSIAGAESPIAAALRLAHALDEEGDHGESQSIADDLAQSEVFGHFKLEGARLEDLRLLFEERLDSAATLF